MVAVYRAPSADQSEPSKVKSVLIDFGVRYVSGGEARYLKEGSIHRENEAVRYDVVDSRTDMVTYRIGAAIEF